MTTFCHFALITCLRTPVRTQLHAAWKKEQDARYNALSSSTSLNRSTALSQQVQPSSCGKSVVRCDYWSTSAA
ncbi:hypothetical protein PR003_g34386 [Phytophthora rubi]|uniref:Secreted protein n=1 Tax=Phytophthora rubi TaxID=129364 RepID=A0A6A4ANR8_9STRA|nr:hypothetical protein PR003_g34386 [Phytophthora rubi]